MSVNAIKSWTDWIELLPLTITKLNTNQHTVYTFSHNAPLHFLKKAAMFLLRARLSCWHSLNNARKVSIRQSSPSFGDVSSLPGTVPLAIWSSCSHLCFSWAGTSPSFFDSGDYWSGCDVIKMAQPRWSQFTLQKQSNLLFK